MEAEKLLNKVEDYDEIDELYDECINYLKSIRKEHTESTVLCEFGKKEEITSKEDSATDYEEIETLEYDKKDTMDERSESFIYESQADYKIENELQAKENNPEELIEMKPKKTKIGEENEAKPPRLRKLSMQLPKIIITRSNNSLNGHRYEVVEEYRNTLPRTGKKPGENTTKKVNGAPQAHNRVPPMRGYASDYPKRLVSKNGIENVALISNVPYEKIRLLNDTFHTLINLRWRWIVSGTIVLHFSIWLVFAVFWYITALAHYDFEPDPPKRTCVTGGKDFVTIFLASVEAQTTIGFGDRTIDEECPESIFLFIMQLILGTGLSGVLTCVVYAKLTRPEKLSRDGVGFSKKAVISVRDGKLCLMMRAWDLNYDHIISSDFSAHFVKTHRTKEGEVIRYYARSLELQQRQFLLWPLTLVHVIDQNSPLYHMTPHNAANYSYEITVSLKGASASMGTFTQSQTSYLPKEILWGYRFPPVVRYDNRKQKYLIEHKKLDLVEPIPTAARSASQLYGSRQSSGQESSPACPGTPSSFSDRISSFHLQRSSSFRKNINEIKP